MLASLTASWRVRFKTTPTTMSVIEKCKDLFSLTPHDSPRLPHLNTDIHKELNEFLVIRESPAEVSNHPEKRSFRLWLSKETALHQIRVYKTVSCATIRVSWIFSIALGNLLKHRIIFFERSIIFK